MGLALRAVAAAALALGAGAAWPAEPQKPRPPVAGLSARVAFEVKAGPLFEALDAIERRTGLAFSVLPELLPPDDPAVEPFTHAGTLAEGLDRLTRPLNLSWEVGDFGGIVVLPKDPPVPSFAKWTGAHFEDTGIEIRAVNGDATGIGLRPGDHLAGLNGERLLSLRDFDVYLQRHLKPAEHLHWNWGELAPILPEVPMVFTVRRAGATFEMALPIVNRSVWPTSLGLLRVTDAPSPWRRYEKGGHRSPAWDAELKAVFDECAKEGAAIDTEALWRRARACRDRGCRDPLLPLMVLERWNAFGEPEWNEFERFFDPRQLRSAYDGQLADARLHVAAAFAIQGPPGVRRQALRRLECGWAWKRAGPSDRLVRDLGYGLAVGHFLRGDDPACLQAMDRVHDAFLDDPSVSRYSLLAQTLLRQMRPAEAAQTHADYVPVGIDMALHARYAALLKADAEVLPSRPHLQTDRLDGPIGLLSWRKMALRSALCRRAGVSDEGGDLLDVEPVGDRLRAIAVDPWPDRVEILLFPRFVKENLAGAGVVGAIFGMVIRDGHLVTEYLDYDQYGVTRELELRRDRHEHPVLPPIPLPGFVNDGRDTLRIFKTREAVSVRCNGVRITTDVSSSDPSQGALALIASKAAGRLDAAVFAPAPRCHDNDRIRELIEEVIDPGRELSLSDVSRRLAEAAGLAAPGNFIKGVYAEAPADARDKIPPPPFAATPPPPLAPLTPAAAEERLRGRGAALWVRPDTEDADLVWCARPNGKLDAMSRVRYWTETHRYVRQHAGADVAVGEPAFTAEAVWFPSARGLFRYDRRNGTFAPVPLAGVFHDAPVKAIAVDRTGRLVIEPEPGAAGGTWTLDPERGRWQAAGGSEPPAGRQR